MTHDGKFAVVDSFINTGNSRITIKGARFLTLNHTKSVGGPWSYPGTGANFRLVAYPFPTDRIFKPIEQAWPLREPIAGTIVGPNRVTYIAYLVQVGAAYRSASLGAIQVSYAESGQDFVADGAFTYKIAQHSCQ